MHPRFHLVANGVVASRPDQMYGWPGLTRVGRNELLVIASERKYHVDPFGRVVIIRSTDAGKTWGLPQEIYNSELDDRDGTILTMPDGTVIAAWFTSSGWTAPEFCRPEWAERARRVADAVREACEGDWLVRSTDGGHTWETTPHPMPPGGAEHSGPFLMRDGALACFGYQRSGRRLTMHFFQSRDKGESWSVVGEVPCRDTHELSFPWRLCQGETCTAPQINERSLLDFGNGHLLAIFRCGNRPRQSRSRDGGKSWTEPRAVPFAGKTPHLLQLQSGALICSYMHRARPYSIRAVFSYDEGETWDAENFLTLQEWPDQPDMGYPVSVEIEPGQILTVHYMSRAPRLHQSSAQMLPRGASPEGIHFTRWLLR
jgi:sialidase-1